MRCAIIGLGANTPGKGGAHSISYLHAAAYQATAGFEIVGACSRSQKNVDDFIAEFGAGQGYQDYRRMLSELRPEMVSVCAYAPDREAMVTAALENGAQGVIIEKPFALTLEAAERMLAKAEASGARLFVNHQRRYGKPFEAFREAASQIGDLSSLEAVQPFSHIMDFGSHVVDIALFALGPARQLKSLFAAVDWNNGRDWQGTRVESHALATIWFNDGVRLTFESGKNPGVKPPLLRLNGSQGFAELHMEPAADVPNVFRAKLAGQADIVSLDSTEHIHHSEDPTLYMRRAVADIDQAMTHGTATRIDATEAWRGLQILTGIYQSAKQQQMLSYA
ncbi:MAG: Gfo/Idh/MocA family oxidoreductase [Candidatus Marinimicrobia bacterium]|nr:Gfo/Idh/MocA family oxidoreductase [Candidatus Neomarinimicrobiota bacterium]